MKSLVFLRGGGGGGAVARRQLACDIRDAVAATPLRAAVNEALDGLPVPAWDMVVELWADSTHMLQALDFRGLVDGEIVQVLSSDQVEKDAWQGAGPPAEAVKQIAAWWRHPMLTRDEARRRWDAHVHLANRVHVGVSRYVRHWLASQPLDGALPYDGVAMQFFAEWRELRDRLFDGPQGQAQVQADVQGFIAGCHVLLVREHHVNTGGHSC